MQSALDLDLSVKISYRSIDYLGFSPQYYYILVSFMIPCVIISCTLYAVLDSGYNVFNDVACLISLIFTYVLFSIYKAIYTYLSSFVLKKENSSATDTPSDKVDINLLLENYMRKVYNIYSENFVIKHFIDKKKQFLIENLPKFLKRSDFEMNQGFLFDLYMKVFNNIKADVVTKVKEEMIGQYTGKLEHEPSDFDNMIVKTSKERMVQLATVIFQWHSLAKEVSYFRSLVEHIKSDKKDLCNMCHSDEKLIHEPTYTMNEMITKYKVSLAGMPSNAQKWQDFYKHYQDFKILCQNCKAIRDITTFKRFKRDDQDIKIDPKSFDTPHAQSILKDVIEGQKGETRTLKLLLMNWFMHARTNLLFRDQNELKGEIHNKVNDVFQ